MDIPQEKKNLEEEEEEEGLYLRIETRKRVQTTVRFRGMETGLMETILRFASVSLGKMETLLLGSWWP